MPLGIEDVPGLTGKQIIITGANSGIGFETTKHLVSKGAHVIMACRNLEKAQLIADSVNAKASANGGVATVLQLDLADLDSIDAFVPALAEMGIAQLFALVLNAGIMMVKYREVATRSTRHPHMESQMASNVVGHFYLVHVLMPLLRVSPGVRVVSVSSVLAYQTRTKESISYDILLCGAKEKYSEWDSYCESKLACIMFARELNRRFKASRVDGLAVAAHPGLSRTKLHRKVENAILRLVCISMSNTISMSARSGALVIAIAAAVPKFKLPERPYFTPNGFMAHVGIPTANGKVPKQGRDDEQSFRLWEICEMLCDIETEI